MMRLYSLFFLFLLTSFSVKSQTARDVAVELFTSWEEGKGLKLQWKSDPNAKRYEVYTKSTSGTGWDLKDTMGVNGLFYLDTTMKKGMVREYRVAKWHTKYTSFAGNGYITAGYEVAYQPLGKVLIAIDSAYTKSLRKEIAQYKDQLEREGWQCITQSFLRSDSVTRIKAWVKNQYMNDTGNVKALILLGRIPVPYSGNFRPDAHPEHTGAWPADLYYGSFSIKWTDVNINNTSAARSNNHNTPGDGKFDLSRFNTTSTLPNAIQYVELPVGRIDLYDMGSFSNNDTLLMARYLRKNLAFRRGELKPVNRGLIDDNFGYLSSEAFASGGFRNFSVYSADSVFERDYVTSMRKNSYLWSYGCGSGNYTSASGVASTNDFVTDSLLNPFTLTFGSYYGDWDNIDNFLRAPLASKGWGLASVWSGRPYWLMHSTALGKPLYAAVLNTYNSYPNYNTASQFSGVHIALMGDPTLKVYPVPSLQNVTISNTCSFELMSAVSWKKSGYDADSIVIELLDSNLQWEPLAVLSALDTVKILNFNAGVYTISVRPKKRMSSASGTWWDMGAREIRRFRVNPLPSLTLNYSKNGYCSGDSIVITDVDYKGPRKIQWQWAVGNKMLTTDTVGTWKGLASAVGKMNLFLTVTSDSGCTSILADSFQVNSLPVVSIIGDSSVCTGTEVQFVYQTTHSSTLKTKSWTVDGKETSQNDSLLLVTGSPGWTVVVLEVIDNNGCKGSDTSMLLSRKVPSKPVFTVMQFGKFRGDTLSVKALSDADSYTWNTNQADLSILQQDSIFSFVIPQGMSSYRLEITAKARLDGCISDTLFRSWIFEFNGVVDLFSGKLWVKEIGFGRYQLNVKGVKEPISAELWSITGAQLQRSIPWVREGDNWQAEVKTNYHQAVNVLVIRDNLGKIIATTKLL